MKKWLLLLLVAAAAGIAFWGALSSARAPGSDAVSSHPAAADGQELHGIGYVEPVSQLRNLMFRTAGVIKKSCFRVGDTVRKGELIAELDDATQRAAVGLARENLAMVRAEATNVNAGINPYRIKVAEQTVERLREKLRHNKVEADRQRRMFSTKSGSHQDYEVAETSQRQTEMELQEQKAELDHLRHFVTPENRAWQDARVKHAQANVELAEEQLRETKLLSPFDGTVLKVLKREGEAVTVLSPDPVILFGDTSRMRVRAEIDERLVRHLAPGQAARVYGRNLQGETHQGKVAYLEQIMGDKTVFTSASSERKDLEVLQVLIDMEPGFRYPAGLRVDVTILGSCPENDYSLGKASR
jgi:multidrug efflux pump subunit AcrA (membrane-fusion protein)